jgi:hypothetical protein
MNNILSRRIDKGMHALTCQFYFDGKTADLHAIMIFSSRKTMNRTERLAKLWRTANSNFNLIRLRTNQVIQKRLGWPKKEEDPAARRTQCVHSIQKLSLSMNLVVDKNILIGN